MAFLPIASPLVVPNGRPIVFDSDIVRGVLSSIFFEPLFNLKVNPPFPLGIFSQSVPCESLYMLGNADSLAPNPALFMFHVAAGILIGACLSAMACSAGVNWLVFLAPTKPRPVLVCGMAGIG